MCPSTWVNGQRISIHAPREGCDWISDCSRLLTSPISIHAPREGCDPPCLIDPVQVNGFQSTHPARGATRMVRSASQLSLFQSTHPARGATCRRVNYYGSHRFQSTHPARGATANFTKEQRVCLAQFAYLHKGKKAEHTKTNAPMLH